MTAEQIAELDREIRYESGFIRDNVIRLLDERRRLLDALGKAEAQYGATHRIAFDVLVEMRTAIFFAMKDATPPNEKPDESWSGQWISSMLDRVAAAEKQRDEARAAALHEVIDHLETMFGYVDAVREVRGLLAVGPPT